MLTLLIYNVDILFSIISPLINIRLFYDKRLAMHLVQMHACAIRKILYDLCVCKEDNVLAKTRV